MLKKLGYVLLTSMLLVGCAQDTYNEEVSIQKPIGATSYQEELDTKASELAEKLVGNLNLEDSMDAPLGVTVIPSIFFEGEDLEISDGCVYLSKEAGNADTVAIIKTDEVKKVKKALETYVDTVKSNTEVYHEQDEKFENAVIESNKSTVILVVCDDYKTAQKEVDKILE